MNAVGGGSCYLARLHYRKALYVLTVLPAHASLGARTNLPRRERNNAGTEASMSWRNVFLCCGSANSRKLPIVPASPIA